VQWILWIEIKELCVMVSRGVVFVESIGD